MIPVNQPLLAGNEERYLRECIETGWISSDGPFVSRFEQAFATKIGAGEGVAVCNGTAALETALYGLNVGAGHEVIMPSFTIISCALAALRLGAIPVLVDIEPKTWCMDVGQVSEKISEKTKAIMAVHIYGHPVFMDTLLDLKERHGVSILEDAAEAHGAQYWSESGQAWRNCGAMGDASAFSFYANKIITTGEGGMVLSERKDVLERARSYRNLCFQEGRRFFHEQLGYNFRMTNLQAAIGLAQVERFDEAVARKRALAAVYKERIDKMPGVRFQQQMEWARSVYWMYAVELNPSGKHEASEVIEKLRTRGIGCRPFFLGLHTQPALNRLGLFRGETYPNTDSAARYGFYLPSGLALKEEEAMKVCDELEDVLV